MIVHGEELCFPFDRFPPIKCAIAYGSVFMPPSRSANVVPSLPDFILVVDDSKASLTEWHQQNMMLNKDHYSLRRIMTPTATSILQAIRPKVFMSPLSLCEFRASSSGSVQKLIKYMVVTEKDLLRDLRKWEDFYLAGRLQKPALFIYPENQGLLVGDNAKLTNEIGGEMGAALRTNLVNATRLSLLLSDKDITLRDLIRTAASLSYLGDSRSRWVNDTIRARGAVTNNLLAYKGLYLPSIPSVRKEWVLRLEEGDDDIIKGRYVPQQFRESQEQAQDKPDEAMRFDLRFADPEEEKLLREVLSKIEEPLKQYIKGSYAARLAGETAARPLPQELQDAVATLSKRQLVMKQAFSSEAHCSLFHSLPDDIQMQAISVSAKRRLGRIFSPFSLLDSSRDREILGGPLPWERTCIQPALEKIVRVASRRACIKGMIMAGATRAGFYSFQKWLGHLGT
eukprot:Protomagalhaensia_wolfi_Nauph_80__5923@NODE_77_length_3935_cov_38_339322_g58_i0_p1_GENE_NODE_77_length_3935_cov_38_339322_g58_i0NODE_77_length_3935_cov_38_339322_g58_i0_p1_ORF_typecomplete_len454_score75_34Tam41_Mmp37/PF09139_11/5_6e53LuxS/PF02664_15/0_14_NODE_77_length_3935_cov_38_339322_g58_i025403901